MHVSLNVFPFTVTSHQTHVLQAPLWHMEKNRIYHQFTELPLVYMYVG